MDVATPTARGVTVFSALDLFAGAGGLSAGLKGSALPIDVTRAVEYDIDAAATYDANEPGTAFHGTVDQWLSVEEIPDVDLVVGGPPCQGFSALGKQDVLDERNALWRDYVRVLEKARPKYFVMENVPQFLDSHQFQQFYFQTVSGGVLEDYAFEARVLNAADFGAAQNRRRAIVIGHHRDLSAPGLPDPITHRDASTVRDVMGDVIARVERIDLPERTFSFAGRELRGVYTTSDLHVTRRFEQISLDRFATIPAGGNRFDIPFDLRPPCWQKHTSGSGDVMGRLRWDRPSVTIRTEFFKPEKGRYLHPDEDRSITHMEAALIQGFPLDFKWVGSKTSIGRQIGNAVPIPLGKAIGDHLAAALVPA